MNLTHHPRVPVPEIAGTGVTEEIVGQDEVCPAVLTPQGDVLRSGRSPYRHGSHPFVFKAYPFIDGEIHSFVSDIIDQQKYANRLISMYDWILRASAKGVLLFPEGALPEGSDRDWTHPWLWHRQ